MLFRSVVPFVQRGGPGGKGAHLIKACISLRSLQEFLTKVMKKWGLQYPMITRDGEYRWVSGATCYPRLMRKHHRKNMDTVRRGARSYFTGTNGEVYETTLSQLTLLHETWVHGIIYYAVLQRAAILADIKAANKRRRKAKAAGVRQRGRRQNKLMGMVPPGSTMPPVFVDVDQFQVIIDPPQIGRAHV